MNKLLKTLFLMLAISALMMGAAFADVATGPMIAMVVGIPVLIVSVIIIVVVIVVQVMKRKKK